MAIDNFGLFRDLYARGQIALAYNEIFERPPEPQSQAELADRIEGMLLGLAIGDALGNTTEGLPPAVRRAQHGEIRDYIPNKYAGMRPVGLPSDDSQMAFWTLEELTVAGGLEPDRLAKRFSEENIFGIGETVSQFVFAYRYLQEPWHRAGQPSAGNGALMRIAPVLIPHLREPSPALWADVALAGMITHNDRASNAACVGFIHLLWETLRLSSPPSPDWWIEKFSRIAVPLEGEAEYKPRKEGIPYKGPVAKFAEEQVKSALEKGWKSLEACESWHSGAYLLETVPCVLHILALHGHDPEEAIVRAVNDTKDNDTVAAIVGAAVGALHGSSGLPRRWIAGLLGRTGEDDDGEVFEIIRRAKEAFLDELPASGPN